MYLVREKKIEDCVDCEKVVTLAWKQTYNQIFSKEFLNSLSLNEEKRIERVINNFYDSDMLSYVLEVDGKIVGVMNCGKTDDINYSDYGELFSMYILEEYKGYGYGKKLFLKASDVLKGDVKSARLGRLFIFVNIKSTRKN